MNAGLKSIALMVGGALLIYAVMLLLVTTIPYLTAAQILPQYPAILLVWISACLLAMVVWRKKN